MPKQDMLDGRDHSYERAGRWEKAPGPTRPSGPGGKGTGAHETR